MNTNPRRQMNDVIIPRNDVIRRPVSVPEQYVPPVQNIKKEDHGRIDTNPFFKKGWKNNGANQERRKRRPLPLILAFSTVLFLVGGFAVANYFANATIEITPISHEVSLNHEFSAVKDANEDELGFKFMSFNEEQSKNVPATVEKKIQKKASGQVLIYNSYSGNSQRLIKNTRLESPDHKIFRIDSSVVVPGAKISGGKVVTPGSVEVTIYADAPGEEYNIGTTNFTIPGFKGDPRFTKFKASSKPDSPISGGFFGTVKVPTEEVILAAQDELRQELKKLAVEKVRSEVPESFSFFPGSVIIKFEDVEQSFAEEEAAKVSVRAITSVFFFDTALLAQKLSKVALPEDMNGEFSVANLPSLTFAFTEPVDNMVLADLIKIRFQVSGEASFVGSVDSGAIGKALAGKPKKDFRTIINDQNNIDNAIAIVRPVWKTTFPLDSKKITVKILTK